MNHLHTWEAETFQSQIEKRWLAWIKRAETLAGHNLDGDQDSDGYSLDQAFALFRAGLTPKQYVTNL